MLTFCLCLFRYIHFELEPLRVLSHLPPFIPAWKDTASEECMYSAGIIKDWRLEHLQDCGWYLDCPPGESPIEERDLKQKHSVAASTTPIDLEQDQFRIAAATSREPPLPSPARPKTRRGKGSDSPLKTLDDTLDVVYSQPPASQRGIRKPKAFEHPFDVHIHPGLVLSATHQKFLMMDPVKLITMKRAAETSGVPSDAWTNLTSFLTLVL